MKRLIFLTAVLVIAAGCVAIANHVGPPELVGLQGRLTDNSGNNVPDGNYTMIFRIYDAPTGGSPSWAETSSVAVSGGLFNYNLGSGNPLDEDIFSGVDPDWLEITVNGEVLSSRMQIVSSPYSQNTARVTGDFESAFNLPTQSGLIRIRDEDSAPDDGEIDFVELSPGTGLSFQDGASELAQYGPGGAVFIPVQPPELQIMASYGPGGAVFIPVQPPDFPVASFHPVNGIMFADTGTGDTTNRIQPGARFMVQSYSVDPLSNVHFSGLGSTEMVFTTAGDTAVRFSPSGLAFGDVGPNHIRYGPSGITMIDNAGDTSLVITPAAVRICAPWQSDDQVVFRRTTGETTLVANDQVIRHCLPYVADTNAGSSQAVQVGERWRDNAIVAWGRVTATGILTNDFGVASAVRNDTGDYTITIDASASLAGNLITMAVVELDSPPTSASAARLIYVNQLGTTPFNKFTVYISNGSFARRDNDFMFMVTAR